MPPETTSGASGKVSLATYRDVDWVNFTALVRWLPVKAHRDGVENAIAWGKTTLRSWLAFFSQSVPVTTEAAVARAAVASFFESGVLRLMCDADDAGYNCQTAFLSVVLREYFEPSAKIVFERASEKEAPYAPAIPSR